jgi:hypothetical protein
MCAAPLHNDTTSADVRQSVANRPELYMIVDEHYNARFRDGDGDDDE